MYTEKINVKWLLVCCFYLLHGCSGSDSPSDSERLDDGRNGQKSLLIGFASDDQMLQQLRNAAVIESTSNAHSILEGAEQAAGGNNVGDLESSPVIFSSTNVQVQGVDEADLIKVSGDQLFGLHTPQPTNQLTADLLVGAPYGQQKPSALYRYQLSKPAKLLEKVLLPEKENWSGIYSIPNAQQLVLLGESESSFVNAAQTSFWWGGGSVALRAVGTAAKSDLEDALWEMSFNGSLVGSRLIDNTLYLVTEYGAPYVHPYAEEPGNINELSLSEWLPQWQLNGEDKGSLVSSGNCYASTVDERRSSTRVTTLLALPLDDPSAIKTRCLLGTAETLFVSQESIYIATTETYYQPWAGDVIDFFFPNSTQTDVHKFSFNSELSYRGGVRLEGHLGWHPQQRSYRMGETEGVLSVITSGGDSWIGEDQQHRLYTLAEKGGELSLLAQLPNQNRPRSIGKPGERIYGTRVLGDRVYVVTFLTSDPLYVIDVSDPVNPFIAGELEVPGFSDYLHPVGEDLLLGIGKSASDANTGDDGRGGWFQGLRLSLFNVVDASNPTLVNALQYGDRGSNSDLFRDFHALAWLPLSANSAKFALPVDLYQHQLAPESPWQYGGYVHRGLYTFVADGSGLRELSTALIESAESYIRNGRTVLSSAGDTWFFDGGELYYADADSPMVLMPSQ